MATKSELFSKCISEAMEAAKGIATPVDKATAYANIAKALAMTMSGGTKATDSSVSDIEPAGKDAIDPDKAKAETKKETAAKAPAAAPAAAKGGVKAPVVAPKAPAKAEEPAPAEDQDDETWTERMQEKYADSMTKFEGFLESYGEDNIKQCVDAFSEGQYKELTDITPLNIEAFVMFLENLAAQQG